MRIRSIHIKGFGCLVDRYYEFPEGKAALVLENNERGKSTLAAAILAGLCGIPKRKAAGELVKLRDIYKPWNSEVYAIEMEIEAAGKRLIVERDFAKDRFTVRDANINRDISAEFDQDLTLHFLRLPRDDFQRIAFISGKEVHRFSSSPNIQAQLSAVVDGSQVESGADIAIASLEEARYNLDGKSLKIESAVSRLSRDSEAREKRMGELDAALDAVASEVRELEETQALCERLTAQLENLDCEYAASKLEESRERIAVAENMVREAAELRGELAELERFAAFPAERKTQLAKSVARIDERESQIAQMEAESERLRRESHQIDLDKSQAIQSERASSRALGYALLAIGGVCGLGCLALMVLRVLGVVPSAVGTVIGIALAAAGALRCARASGKSTRMIALGARSQEIERRLSELARDIDGRRRDIDEEREVVRSIAQDARIESSPPHDDVLRKFEETEAHYRRYRLVKDTLIPNAMKYVPSDEELNTLKAEEAELAAQASAPLPQFKIQNSKFKIAPSPSRPSSAVDSERQEVRTDLDQARDRIRELERSVGLCVETYRREYPVLTDELAGIRRHIELVTRFGMAVQTAAGVMREVAEQSHRRWASALNARASNILPHLNPDYDTLLFDDSLSFTIRRVSDKRVIERAEVDACLSTGAKDQIYLAVRLACGEELSQATEPTPVILDDPLIAADDVRFREGLRHIACQATEGHQVIILSCHRSRHETLAGEDWFSDHVAIVDL